jgi:hypothetical protein
MLINEAVIDHLAHWMHHYFVDHPDADDVEPDVLAEYVLAHGVCRDCVANFVRTVGADTFPEAIQRVWDSAVWQAFRARIEAAEET